VWCVLEPRSWSLRRNVFQDRLPLAFDHADEVVLSDVFGADQLPPEERLDPGRLVADLARRDRRARFLPGVDAIVSCLAVEARPGDVIAVLSNGGFGGIHAKLLAALAAKLKP
jgi:UDP-N-acetylmuramate: L-alanyl-gamma-D-glutamyl-meso-diaminopimelate ligase